MLETKQECLEYGCVLALDSKRAHNKTQSIAR
jgi:hypothetical protein